MGSSLRGKPARDRALLEELTTQRFAEESKELVGNKSRQLFVSLHHLRETGGNKSSQIVRWHSANNNLHISVHSAHCIVAFFDPCLRHAF